MGFFWKNRQTPASSTSESTPNNNKGCVTLTVALPFYIRKYLKAKEGLWKSKFAIVAILAIFYFFNLIFNFLEFFGNFFPPKETGNL
jgi:hypothetical protein